MKDLCLIITGALVGTFLCRCCNKPDPFPPIAPCRPCPCQKPCEKPCPCKKKEGCRMIPFDR